MKHVVWTFLLAVVLCMGFQGNCFAEETDSAVSLDEVKQQAGQTLDAAKNYTIEQKREYQKKLESELSALSNQITDLKTKAGTAKQEMSAALEAKLGELKKKQKDVEEKMRELQAATSTAWEKVKTQADSSMEDLKKAYESAKSHFE